MSTAAFDKERLIFFDNLRLCFVVFVVLEHSGNAYSNLSWWPVADEAVSMAVGWFSAFFDALNMPLLFFISGYFAIPTMRKRGPAAFLIGKLKRLGIPWLVCILAVCPVLPLVYHYTRDGFRLTTGYWDLWARLMGNFLRFDFGIVPSMDALMQNDGFYQRYMWFLSLLILFFCLFGAIYAIRTRWFDRSEASLPDFHPTAFSALKMILAVGLLTAVPSFCIVGLILTFGPESSGPEPLFSLFNVIQFRPSRLTFFILYFGMGILCYRNRWIERDRFDGRLKTWAGAFCVLLTAYLYTRHIMLYGPGGTEEIAGVVMFFILSFLTASGLGLSVSLASRYWNRPSQMNRNPAANSYNIYLSHYLFVITFQLILLSVPGIPGLVKFAVVSAVSVSASCLISRRLIQPHPKLAVGAALGLFVVMAALIRP